jgi:heme-degrading monooxygenase HmoA
MTTTDELARRVDRGFAEAIAGQPGFLGYQFLECGGGEVITTSLFSEAEQAQASRELAQRWSAEELPDFEFTITEALHGEVVIARSLPELLEPCHAGEPTGRFCRLRRYRMLANAVAEVMALAEADFADGVSELDGFIAFFVIDCGGGDVLSISVFRDRDTADRADAAAWRFASEDLGRFDIKRNEAIGGGAVLVSRATSALVQPAHA